MPDHLIDDIARTLASPKVPRRDAVKLIAGAFAGAAMAFFGGRIASGAGCKKNETVCGSTCCPPGQECKNNACCPSGQVCGSLCCPTGQICTEVQGQKRCKPGRPSVSGAA